MFEVLATDYERASDALYFPNLADALDATEDSREYWLQMMESMLVRKFRTPSDAVYLGAVAKALRECSTGDPRVEMIAKDIDDELSLRIVAPNGASGPTFDDVLYGRLMHADWGRYLATQRLSPQETAGTLYVGGKSVSNAIYAALDGVRLAMREGILRYD